MEERIEKVTVVYNLVSEVSPHSSSCSFCGKYRAVSDYEAGPVMVQVCGGCAENPPGAVEATPETKKKKK